MSLVIGVVQTDFIIASSDTAVTIWSYDKEEARRTGECVETEEVIDAGVKSEKVIKLTDKVLITTCGSLVLTELIFSEMQYYIKDYYDLKQCREVAKKVMSNINKGVFLNKQNFFNALLEKYNMNYFQIREIKKDFNAYIQNLLSLASKVNKLITSFAMYLLGFNDDGSSGLVDVSNGTLMNGPVNKKEAFPIVLNGPDIIDYLQSLNLPIEERNIEGFVNRMSALHAQISKDNQVNVSSDCNYHILMRSEDGIIHQKITFDTSEIQKVLQ